MQFGAYVNKSAHLKICKMGGHYINENTYTVAAIKIYQVASCLLFVRVVNLKATHAASASMSVHVREAKFTHFDIDNCVKIAVRC